MSFRVLGPDGAEGSVWRELLERLPREARDLHYRPEYGLIYRDTYGHDPLLASYADGPQLVVQALVRRSLAALPFLADRDDAKEYADVATPYGFGGPLISEPCAENAIESLFAFDRQLRAWCAAERIATDFVCLHPVLGNHEWVEKSGLHPLCAQKQVVIIDLTKSEDALWAEISRGTRSSIARARRAGVTVERVEPDARALDAFQRLYVATMHRHSAAERWFFPESYFPSCVRRLGYDSSALFFARCEGEIAAAYLLLNDERTAYYHFGASDARFLDRRPNNLLMYETLLWAKARGLRNYHLGGGVTAAGNDTLLRFKSSFGGYRAGLYTYGRVLDEEIYRRLCELKLDHERRTSATVANPHYFPCYRR
jgi:hypothetical protein